MEVYGLEEKKAIESLIEIREFANLSSYKDTKISQLNAIDVVLNLIEKQSKEIEELNLKNEKLYEDNLTLAQEIKEFIEGTNDVKYYSTSFIKNHYISKDKIKAKIEYYEKIDNPVGKKVLQSLLEKE